MTEHATGEISQVGMQGAAMAAKSVPQGPDMGQPHYASQLPGAPPYQGAPMAPDAIQARYAYGEKADMGASQEPQAPAARGGGEKGGDQAAGGGCGETQSVQAEPQGYPMPGQAPQFAPQGYPMPGQAPQFAPQGYPMPGQPPKFAPQGYPMPGQAPQFAPQGAPVAEESCGKGAKENPAASAAEKSGHGGGCCKGSAGTSPHGAQPMPGYAPPFTQGYAPGYQGAPFYGPPNSASQQEMAMHYGHLYGLIREAANGQPDISGFLNFFQSVSSDFWKGALVGTGIALLFTTDAPKAILARGLAGLSGAASEKSHENPPQTDNAPKEEEADL